MSVCLTLDEVTRDATFRGTAIQRKCVLDCLCAKSPSVSAPLHELAALVLDLRIEIAWGFGEAPRGVRETLPSHTS